jgi:hypothetical protein
MRFRFWSDSSDQYHDIQHEWNFKEDKKLKHFITFLFIQQYLHHPKTVEKSKSINFVCFLFAFQNFGFLYSRIGAGVAYK